MCACMVCTCATVSGRFIDRHSLGIALCSHGQRATSQARSESPAECLGAPILSTGLGAPRSTVGEDPPENFIAQTGISSNISSPTFALILALAHRISALSTNFIKQIIAIISSKFHRSEFCMVFQIWAIPPPQLACLTNCARVLVLGHMSALIDRCRRNVVILARSDRLRRARNSHDPTSKRPRRLCGEP